MVDIGDPGLTVVCADDVHLTFALQLLEFRLDVLHDTFGHLVTIHVGHRTDTEFANDFGRNDCLCACAGECAFNAVQRERRVPPSMQQNVARIGVDPHVCTH